jgi:hypothetical protein
MKIQNPKRKRILITAVATGTLLLSRPAFAIFGLPQIVFDPIAIGKLAVESSQLGQMISQGLKMISWAKNTYNEVQSQYNQMIYQARQFTNKSYWRSVGVQMMSTNTYNTYGETRNWSQTVNTNTAGVGASTQAWDNATIALQNNPWLRTEPLGQSTQLATYATAEITDGASRLGLDILGATSTAQTNNLRALQLLETDALDRSTAANTQTKQLNIIGGGTIQELHSLDTLISLQKASLQLAIAQNKVQRDAAAHAANLFTAYDSSLVNESTDWGNAAETFSGYRVP